VRQNGYGDAEDESNQDATVTSTEDSNQAQDVDEDNVGEFESFNFELEVILQRCHIIISHFL
jgi:hypothetical protein